MEVAKLVPKKKRPELADRIEVGGEGSGVSFARAITRKDNQSQITFGGAWLEPGKTHPEWKFTNAEEIYFCVSGTLILRWNEGELPVSSGDAFHCPPGWSYTLSNIGDDEAYLVYAMYPPSE